MIFEEIVAGSVPLCGTSAAVVPYGLWLRHGLPETAFAAGETPVAPRTRPSLKRYIRPIVLTAIMLSAATIANYSITYLTTYSIHTLRLSPTIAFGAPIVGGICFVISEPLSGWLSDVYGRRPVMLIPGVLLLLAIWPMFYFLNLYPDAIALYITVAVLVVLQGLCTTPILTSFVETIPAAVRAGTVGIVYALAISTFGGSAQYVIKKLIDVLHDPLAPAYYMGITFLIGLVAMFMTRETAPAKLANRPSLKGRVE